MTIPYNAGIPASSHNPSQDQPLMLENFTSISEIWEVDHVGFGTNPSGTHLQVTFSSENTPSTPSDPSSVLYTAGVNGKPALYFANSANSSYYIGGASGATVLTAGILMQWGTFTISSGQTQSSTINWPLPFPNAVYSVQITADVSSPVNNNPSYTISGLTGFVGYRPGTTGNVTYSFLAIGS